MDDARRANSIAESQAAVERLEDEIRRLEPVVGNPEDIVDQHGWLPKDRRQHTWWTYRLDREWKVGELKARIPDLEAGLRATPTSERAARRARRDALNIAQRELDELVAEGPYTADEMCSECPTPMAHHGWAWPPAALAQRGQAGLLEYARFARGWRPPPSVESKRRCAAEGGVAGGLYFLV